MNVCIIQARMGSARLPGKVMLPLNGHTVISEVVARCWQIPGIDLVVVATPDDVIEKEIGSVCKVVRGPEHDVLSRYVKAARETDAKVIMRITADCPLLCPELCGLVLNALPGHDYASNVEPRTFPQGYDCEAFTFETLYRAGMESDEREHVTTWMRSADIKRVNVRAPFKMEGRLTLDTEDDYRVICAAFGHEPYQCLRAA